ncbi:uncharacterized protein N7506_000020 [Penicillium brevicompactum]|uniref:uncharacterized protein n=1 Tax=Penicillium brevicompactum TaxID=5074 RepID=UPI0025421EBB|nr:uncharacterized protein N7506_000020 [Penicillium brevicompactum]KAJ5346767.1 hypothetical protein N7506_000020 [Penicillium brevicompactum]
MASLSQHLVKMLSARHGSFLFRIFSLLPQLSLSLHRDYLSAHRLFSSLLRVSLICHFCSLSRRYRPSTLDLPATSFYSHSSASEPSPSLQSRRV